VNVVIKIGCDWWKLSLRVVRNFRDFCDGNFKIWVKVCM